MEMLILGVLLWSIVHIVPVVLRDFRACLIEQMGEKPYKGVFSLLIFASIALIIFGWQSVEERTILFDIYNFTIIPAFFMLLAGFVLIVAANLRSNFKRVVRHPQLTGFALWAFAHFLVNGELRANVLFGALFVWSIVMIVLLNKRDGAFVPPAKQLPHKGVMVFALAATIFIAAVLGHGYFTGIDLTVAH